MSEWEIGNCQKGNGGVQWDYVSMRKRKYDACKEITFSPAGH